MTIPRVVYCAYCLKVFRLRKNQPILYANHIENIAFAFCHIVHAYIFNTEIYRSALRADIVAGYGAGYSQLCDIIDDTIFRHIARYKLLELIIN